MTVTKNVVDMCTQPGMVDRLDVLQVNLTLCEKALSEYLETKRLAFPRFYFVSSADLLDILSNGNNPELVSFHIIHIPFYMLITHRLSPLHHKTIVFVSVFLFSVFLLI